MGYKGGMDGADEVLQFWFGDGRKDLDALAVIQQLENDGSGVLRVASPTAPFDPEQGARLRGTTVQFGLREAENEEIWRRIEALLAAVDEGDLGVF